MPAKLKNPNLEMIYERLRHSGPRGAALAELLDRRGTTVRFAPIKGGFTLNFLNTVFLEPLPANHSGDQLNFWASLLAHEACHVEQRFFVDSLQQEIRAYIAQCQVAEELGMTGNAFIDRLRAACENVDVTQIPQLQQARQALDELFGNQPATMLYNALPVIQPRGVRAVPAALTEIRALARTLFIKKT